MIHIIVGDEAAKNLQAAFELDENLRGEILVLKDTLGVGPITLENHANHDAVRTEFWRIVSGNVNVAKVEDRSNVLLLIDKALEEEEPVCFWLSPCVTDVSAYLWLLPMFKKYDEMLHTINIIGLPFLNEKGQLFYPKNFSEVHPKEFCKTKRLLKKITPAEFEVEGDEWNKLQSDHTWVRLYEGGKKIISKPLTHFDSMILSCIATEFQKGSKIVNEVLKKSTQTVSNLFYEWRLRELCKGDELIITGDLEKAAKDFEVKKPSSETPATPELFDETNAEAN